MHGATVVVIFHIDPHRVEMAVGVVDAPVPDALVPAFGAVVQVNADVEAVIGRCTDVVGHVVEEVLSPTVPSVR